MIKSVLLNLLVVLLVTGISGSIQSAVTVTESVNDHRSHLTMENGFLKITIDPSRGGRISSYIWKADDTEWLPAGSNSGMFMDHVTQQKWPGELLDRKYEYEILSRGPQSASVKLWTVIKGEGDENISGVKFVKTLSLKADSPLIKAIYRLENTTDRMKSPALWIQNIVAVGGFSNEKYNFRPTTEGPLESRWGSKFKNAKRVDSKIEFRFDPIAGWIAELHSPTRQGLVFYVDYNWLKCLYCCQGGMTTEWWYERSTLLPGSHFETEVQVWPVFGLSAVAHASEHCVAQLDLKREGTSVRMINRMVMGPKGKTDFKVKLELLEFPNMNCLAQKEVKVQDLSNEVQDQILKVKGVNERTDIVARVTLSGSDWQEHYERFSPGSAILGTETQYRIRRPPRQRSLYKPEKIVKVKNTTPKILHIRGLFHYFYRWPEITSLLKGTLKSSSYTISIFGPSISYFPTNYDELMRYDVIVLSNVPIDGFGDEQMVYIEDFVKHGGVLFVIGGPMSFYAGGYKNSWLERLLPVNVAGPFDIGKLDKPHLLVENRKGAGYFQYYQKIAGLKNTAKIVAGTEQTPIVIERKYGQGITALFLPLCLGQFEKNIGFWQVKEYPLWMANIIHELLNHTDIYGNKQ